MRQQHFQQQLSSSDSNGNLQQPSSLPPDLTMSGVDLHRLRELRRAARDDCEQLLQRREQLQQDVVLLARQLSSTDHQLLQLSATAEQLSNGSGGGTQHKRLSSASKRNSLDYPTTTAGKRSSASNGTISSSSNPSNNPASSSSAPATSTAMSPAHAFSSLARAYKVHMHTFPSITCYSVVSTKRNR